MNIENTERLLTAYPLLYRELRESSFECGDGWFDLVWQLSAEIESLAYLEGISKITEAWPSIVILKQKFGSLRVQFDKEVSEHIEALLSNAYNQSMETCELCGAPAKLLRELKFSRRVKVLCENCHKAHQ
jgi:ribosomal protein S14